MENIYDAFTAAPIAAYYQEAVTNKIPLLGTAFFPARKQLGLDLSWFRGYKGVPVSLAPAAFDAKAPIRDRIGLSKESTEMPFFRESMRIGEKDRQELNKVLSGLDVSYVRHIIDRIYDDAKTLIEGAEVVPERMRMQLLSTGQISIDRDGVGYDYNYNFPDQNRKKLTGQKLWSDTKNSTPIQDIRKWQKEIETKTGIKPTKAICTSETFDWIVANESIRYDMNVRDGDRLIVTEAEIASYLAKKLDGFEVYIYDKKFAPKQKADAENYFPNGIFTLIPSGKLGETVFGTTPEENDLLAGNNSAKVEIVDVGVAVTTYEEVHPVNRITVVSEIVLPTFEAIDSTVIAKVS